MKHWLALPLLALSVPSVAQTRVETNAGQSFGGPIVVALDAVPTSALVTMLLRDVMRVPYVIAPDVLADRKATSVRLVIPRNDIPARVVTYLRRAGFTVELVGGTVYVGRGGRSPSYIGSAGVAMMLQNPDAVPQGSPVDGLAGYRRAESREDPDIGKSDYKDPGIRGSALPSSEPSTIVAYLPAHRDPAYLSSVIAAVLPGIVFGARSDAKAEPDHQTIRSEAGPDVLVMAGSDVDIVKARQLVTLLDRPRAMVAVKAVVLQMSSVQARGSALSILASIAGGKVQVGSLADAIPASQFVRISVGGVKAVLSAVREDSRFKVVATPNLAALSGEVASMNSGASVPTVGAVSFPEGGTPVQSIVYRDSGITLSVRPVVRGPLVELSVRQERSTFTRTATGVEDSPTLQKSVVDASVVMRSGESVVLAGLTEASEGKTREGLLGGLLGVRSRDKSDSELLVVITAELVPQPDAPPGQFLPLEPIQKEDNLAPA